jgi:ferredoxin--NADP+ reductase
VVDPAGVGLYERRLRRAALDRVGAGDAGATGADAASLDAVFAHVARRRAGRARPGVAPTERPTPIATSGPTSVAETPGGAGTGWHLLHVDEVGPTLRLLRVERPPGFEFTAGQYVKAGVEGVGRSSFSIASSPHDPFIELCVGLQPGGKVSPALFRLAPGDVVDLVPRAKGRFVLDPTADTHLMVATSTGIGPLRSMLRDSLHRGLPGRFVVLHGASTHDRLPYREELGALGGSDPRVSYRSTISGRAGGVSAGRVDPLAERAAGDLDPSSTVAYVCGHPGMVDSVRATLSRLGFEVRSEKFD